MVITKTVPTTTPSTFTGAGVWVIVAGVLAVVGGIVLYFLFTSKKNNGEYNGFLAWLHSFLRFDKMMVESMLKILYLIAALFITLSSFAFISSSFLSFLLYLVFGNIFARVMFEFSILGIQLWKNTAEIKDAITDKKIAKETKDTKESKK